MHRLLLLSLVITTGCVASSGDESFVVLNNIAPGEDCTLSADANGAFQSRGTLYLNSPNPYVLTPLVQSRITAAMGQELQRTVALRGARVDLTIEAVSVVNGDTITDFEFSATEIADLEESGALKFTSLFAAPLPPRGTAAATFDVVPLRALAAIRAKTAGTPGAVHAQLVARATLFGDLGGDEVTGVPFVYPIAVCSDCIVNVVADACPAPLGTMVNAGNSCNPFQDGTVDCCTDTENGTLVCPTTVATE